VIYETIVQELISSGLFNFLPTTTFASRFFFVIVSAAQN